MKSALLDVNVLLALAWPNHQHHAAAHAWFTSAASGGWCTTGGTQLAFIRLSSNPAYTTIAVAPITAADYLKDLTAHPKHRYLEMPPAAVPEVYTASIGHKQVNDAYLVSVARYHGTCLITFDQRLTAHDPERGVVKVLY